MSFAGSKRKLYIYMDKEKTVHHKLPGGGGWGLEGVAYIVHRHLVAQIPVVTWCSVSLILTVLSSILFTAGHSGTHWNSVRSPSHASRLTKVHTSWRLRENRWVLGCVGEWVSIDIIIIMMKTSHSNIDINTVCFTLDPNLMIEICTGTLTSISLLKS